MQLSRTPAQRRGKTFDLATNSAFLYCYNPLMLKICKETFDHISLIVKQVKPLNVNHIKIYEKIGFILLQDNANIVVSGH